MSEQKQVGQLFAVMMQNMPEMTSEQRQKWITNPQGLKTFLLGLTHTTSKAPNFTGQTFTDKINYDLSVDQLISLGRYKWHYDKLKYLTGHHSKTGILEIDQRLFHFEIEVDHGDVVIEMDKFDYRPANLKELLNFGANHPELQREFPIVALGSFFAESPDRNFPYLGVGRAGRDVDIGGFFAERYFNCRFLGIRNQ